MLSALITVAFPALATLYRESALYARHISPCNSEGHSAPACVLGFHHCEGDHNPLTEGRWSPLLAQLSVHRLDAYLSSSTFLLYRIAATIANFTRARQEVESCARFTAFAVGLNSQCTNEKLPKPQVTKSPHCNGRALSLINLDTEMPLEALDELRQLPGIAEARVVVL